MRPDGRARVGRDCDSHGTERAGTPTGTGATGGTRTDGDAAAHAPRGRREWLECLALDVAGGIRSGRVIEVLAQLVSVHGAPRYLRSDNGPEFVATAILRWLGDAGIDTALIDPGKP